MSELKATPGPWSASVEPRPFKTGGYWYVVLDEDENGLGEFYGDDHETNAANLRLAAAARELYEALAEIVGNADELDIMGMGDSFEKATAALRKARGETA